MSEKYSRLSLAEWQTLFEMEGCGRSSQEIAKILCRDRRSVERALKRYPLPWHYRERGALYRARYSWEEAERRRGAPRRRERLKNSFIRFYVEAKLTVGWSPELIAGRLSVEHPRQSISYEAIYDWIFKERPDLKEHLLRAGKTKRGKPGGRQYPQRQPAAPKKSIEIRDSEANERIGLGHKESDLIVSSKSDACLLVMVDRCSRKVRLRKVSNRQASTVKAALVSILAILPPHLRKTLTQDNGSEHALHRELEVAVGISVYFCHPYSAWERGTVENRNGFIRRYFPKGTDFTLVSDEEIARIEQLINSRPMVIHGFRSPDEIEEEQLKLAA